MMEQERKRRRRDETVVIVRKRGRKGRVGRGSETGMCGVDRLLGWV